MACRWLRYSVLHDGVGDALRQLKAGFARGEGRLRFVAIDGARQKRSRRTAEAENRVAHPVATLRGD